MSYSWDWYEASEDDVQRIKTNQANHPGIGSAADGNNYWYDESGTALLRWNKKLGRSEIRVFPKWWNDREY